MPLVTCPDCNAEISDAAPSCPKCGRPMSKEQLQQSVPPPKKKGRLWKTIGIGFALLMVVGAVGNALKSPEEKAAEAQQAAKREEARRQAAIAKTEEQKNLCANIKSMADWEKASTLWRSSNPECKPKESAQTYAIMSAAALWKEFDNNEVAAEKAYKNKRVAIEGRISKIETSLMGYPEISFALDQYGLDTVKCQFSKKESDTIAGMAKGQKVVVIGKVTTFALGSMLNLDDCTFGNGIK